MKLRYIAARYLHLSPVKVTDNADCGSSIISNNDGAVDCIDTAVAGVNRALVLFIRECLALVTAS